MNRKIFNISIIGLMAALSYISFTFLQIKVPTPGGYTSFHLGNTFCVLGALVAGGVSGGLAGAIGMGIGDLLDPVYVVSAPKTILMKFTIGLLTGFMAHKILHITKRKSNSSIFIAALMASSIGMLFNIIFDPILGYLYKRFILGISVKAATILASWSAITTITNAILTVICASILYVAIVPTIKKYNP